MLAQTTNSKQNMPTSDSILVFIRSSLPFNFAVLVSSSDDIAALKKKTEAQYLELFPHRGRIRVEAIKAMLNGKDYTVADSCHVNSFVDRAKRCCSFLMDATELPPFPSQSHAHISQTSDTSSDKDLIDTRVSPSCMHKLSKRKLLKDGRNKDLVVEEELTVGVDDLGASAQEKVNEKISKEPSPGEVLTCNERESPKKGDQIRESNAAIETVGGLHLKGGSSPARNPDVENFEKDEEDTFTRPACTSVARKFKKECQIKPKQQLNLEDFNIEETEGSGSCGTVYKVRRKSDGELFAVKCPHPKANPHHVMNEIKMLERFGGKNFVIKYKGSFKSGNSECVLLEHVEHDRPEVLNKEISVLELRWYGYYLFKALASLHKQGTAHHDVKPGNFLFSRKLNKGYLIDFNLASDLHQVFFNNAKRMDPGPSSVCMTNSNRKKENQHQILKRKWLSEKQVEVGSRQEKIQYSQKITDELGMTSIKDLTSTRASQERRTQPIMFQALRKKLVNFLEDTTLGCPNEFVGFTVPRKRVTVSPVKSDTSQVICTPMPLYCGGAAVAGSGAHNSKGEGKHRKESPIAGTKGFCAPETLFKSLHQSCKIDIWSAGVTLLYLIIGKVPFGGDLEQNMTEIAKLRGNEDLWEVAKLHDCERFFPMDLFDVQYVQSMNLRDWCGMNSCRPEFIEVIPNSLFDLIDKCLTVNPRCRVSAEEAIAHSFFSECRESLGN